MIFVQGQNENQKRFDEAARAIHLAHRSQTVEQVHTLNEKYSRPIWGEVHIWEMLEKLAMAVDPTDKELYGVSQWIHTWQVVEAMIEAHEPEDMLVAGMLHDLGKVLLVTGEDPANIVCDNYVIGDYPEGCGWDNCVFQWNHDEFAYLKLRDHIPAELSWIIRYHSVSPSNYKFMDARDRWLFEKYFQKFRAYDKGTKSIFRLPAVDFDRCRQLLEKWLPNRVVI